MGNVTWLNKEEFLPVCMSKLEKDVEVLLDIGTGIIPHDYIEPTLYICVEPFKGYVEELNKKLATNNKQLYLVLNTDWEGCLSIFGENSVDTVFLIDVIEHLDMADGLRLLALTEKIARRQIVVFTPLGYIEQHRLHGNKDIWGLDGADWQDHKSGWHPQDFGDDWDIYICKNYHSHNNIGELLETPVGAIWAIKNNDADCRNYTWIDGDLLSQLLKRLQILKKNQAESEQSLLQQLDTSYQLTETLYHSIRCLDNDKNSMARELENAHQERTSLLVERGNITVELENAYTEIKKLGSEQRELSGELTGTYSEIKRLNTEHDLLSAELSGIYSEVARLNSEHGELAAELTAAYLEIKRLNSERDGLASELTAAYSEIKRLNVERGGMAAELTTAYSEINRLNTGHDLLSSELSGVYSEIKRLNSDCHAIAVELAESYSEITRLNSEISRLAGEMRELYSAIDTLLRQNNEKEWDKDPVHEPKPSLEQQA